MEKADCHLTVVVPAFNEEQRIGATLEDILNYLERQSYVWEVVVVDDGSTDQTAAVVSAFAPRVRLCGYALNRGKGYAVRHGLARSRGDFCLFMDADNSTRLEMVESFWPPLMDDQADIVIGSRMLTGSDIGVRQPRWREWLGMLGNLWIRFWTVRGLKDTQAGFKLLRKGVVGSVLPKLTIDGWGFDVELLAVARWHGFRVKEMPIRWVHGPQSRVRLSAYLAVLADVVRIRLNRWRGKYSD